MPPEARCRRPDPDEPTWGYAEELMAQIVEEVSVLVADQRRKKPREVPRPWKGKGSAKDSTARSNTTRDVPRGEEPQEGAGGRQVYGFRGMLGLAKKRMTQQGAPGV